MTDTISVDVSPLALSILELLSERPMHPYELAATMRSRHHDEFIRLNFGSLYHTVEVLERNGWIVSAEREKEGGRPERGTCKHFSLHAEYVLHDRVNR